MALENLISQVLKKIYRLYKANRNWSLQKPNLCQFWSKHCPCCESSSTVVVVHLCLSSSIPCGTAGWPWMSSASYVPAQWNNLLQSLLHASSSLVCKTWTREEEEEEEDEVHHMCMQNKTIFNNCSQHHHWCNRGTREEEENNNNNKNDFIMN